MLVPHQTSSLIRPFWEFRKLQPLWVSEGCEASWLGSSAISRSVISSISTVSWHPFVSMMIFLLLPFLMIVHLDSSLLLFWHLFLRPLQKEKPFAWGADRSSSRHSGGRETRPVAEGVAHQMQPLDRFGDVQWCLTGNRTSRCKMRHIAFSHDSWQWI